MQHKNVDEQTEKCLIQKSWYVKICITTYCTSRDTRTYMIRKTDMDTQTDRPATVLSAYDYRFEMPFHWNKATKLTFHSNETYFSGLLHDCSKLGWNAKITAIFTVDTKIIIEKWPTYVWVSKIYWQILSFNSRRNNFMSSKRLKVSGLCRKTLTCTSTCSRK